MMHTIVLKCINIFFCSSLTSLVEILESCCDWLKDEQFLDGYILNWELLAEFCFNNIAGFFFAYYCKINSVQKKSWSSHILNMSWGSLTCFSNFKQIIFDFFPNQSTNNYHHDIWLKLQFYDVALLSKILYIACFLCASGYIMCIKILKNWKCNKYIAIFFSILLKPSCHTA